MRPEWASSTDINKTPVSKLVVYKGMINDVTLSGLGPITQNHIHYNYSHNFQNQLQLHCLNFNYNYIMRNQIYSAFVNYVFLHVFLNFNILYTTNKQI